MENSLVSLFKQEPFQKEYELAGFKIKLQALSRKQYDEVLARAQISLSDSVSKQVLIRRPILGYALIAINDIPIQNIAEVSKKVEEFKKGKKDDVKVPFNLLVEDALGELGSNFVEEIYALYERLEDEDAERFAALKKA